MVIPFNWTLYEKQFKTLIGKLALNLLIIENQVLKLNIFKNLNKLFIIIYNNYI